MAFEIIKSIVEAEQQAEAIKARALTNAEEIRRSAAQKSGEIALDAKNKAKLEEERLIKEAIAAQSGRVKEILEDARVKAEDIGKTAAARREEAITAVVGKVVGKDGNS